jgi:hypothetical protein
MCLWPPGECCGGKLNLIETEIVRSYICRKMVAEKCFLEYSRRQPGLSFISHFFKIEAVKTCEIVCVVGPLEK